MDWFDIPFVPPPGPKRRLSARENAAAMICLVVLPMVDLCLVMFTDLSKDPGFAVLWLPGILTALSVVVCRALRVSGIGQSLILPLGCLWWSFFASVTLVVIDILIFPF